MSIVAEVLALWDFSDPAQSERRFLDAYANSREAWRDVFITQAARSYGLRQDFAKARVLLQELEPNLVELPIIVSAYYWLELGRSYASAAHREDDLTAEARQLARQAYQNCIASAAELGNDYLAIDALHMLAMVEHSLDEQLTWNYRAMERVQVSQEPEAKRWEGALCNNIGYALHLAGKFDEALDYFAQSKQACLSQGNAQSARIADWMIAWTYRVMGRTEDALTLQLSLEEQNNLAGTPDSYVYEELEQIYRTLGNEERAAHYAALRAGS